MQNMKIDLRAQQTVLVLGGFGFIGRHIVEHLKTLNVNIVIGSRRARDEHRTNSRTISLHKLKHLDQWLEQLKDIDIVINSVGILRQRHGESYQQVHDKSVGLLAQACERKRIRLVHISALGLDNPVRSRFLSSKRNGEAAIQKTNADWHIVRPSLIHGVGGYGSKWFQRVARWPIHFAPANAHGMLCPVHVADVAEAVCRIALGPDTEINEQERIYELGGAQRVNLFDYLLVLAPRPPILTLCIPSWAARAISHLFDILHLTPFSFGHYELLKFDNCPADNALLRLIGRAASPIGQLEMKPDKLPNEQAFLLDSYER